jgi:hypothetical protein
MAHQDTEDLRAAIAALEFQRATPLAKRWAIRACRMLRMGSAPA